VLEADTIIITIGQMSKNDLFTDSSVKMDKGRVEWNKATQMSTGKNIFVAGEVVTGPGSAIAAVANGRRAALAMHLYLQGEAIEGRLPVQEKEKIGQMPSEVAEKVAKIPRRKIKHLPPEVRVKTMDHFEMGYSEQEALEEAGRCRGCGGGAVVDQKKCMACLTCMRVCPYGAPVVEAYSTIRPEYCQACGLCAPECPAQAISMVSYDVREIRNTIPNLIGKVDATRKDPVIVALTCNHHAKVIGVPNNVKAFPVHCTSRIDTIDLLKAFESGADGVAVVRCNSGTCKYRDIEPRVNARVKRAQDLLSGIGIDKGRIEILSASDANGHAAVAAEFTERVKKIGIRAK
jgi:formate dehydrogenase beta subunit